MNIERLRAVKQAILEHPNNVDMDRWVSDNKSPLDNPNCGTVACVAGWTLFLFNPMLIPAEIDYRYDPSSEATELLDLTRHQSHVLFYDNAWPLEFESNLLNQTEETDDGFVILNREKYAQVVADRIEHFIKTGE